LDGCRDHYPGTERDSPAHLDTHGTPDQFAYANRRYLRTTGHAAQAAVDEKKRRAAQKRASQREKAARKAAEKAGRLDEYIREKRKAKEAAIKAEAERILQKDNKKRAAKKREQSGLTGRELREKEAQQVIWDANGAAIYAATHPAQTSGLKVDAKPIPPETAPDPYDGIGDWIERQDQANATVIAEFKRQQTQKSLRERILGLKESFLGFNDPHPPPPTPSWQRADSIAAEDYREDKEVTAAWTEIETMRAQRGRTMDLVDWKKIDLEAADNYVEKISGNISIYSNSLSISDLLKYQQNQGSTNYCGSYSLSMGINLLYGTHTTQVMILGWLL
jgi:hypothetical protein